MQVSIRINKTGTLNSRIFTKYINRTSFRACDIHFRTGEIGIPYSCFITVNIDRTTIQLSIRINKIRTLNNSTCTINVNGTSLGTILIHNRTCETGIPYSSVITVNVDCTPIQLSVRINKAGILNSGILTEYVNSSTLRHVSTYPTVIEFRALNCGVGTVDVDSPTVKVGP